MQMCRCANYMLINGSNYQRDPNYVFLYKQITCAFYGCFNFLIYKNMHFIICTSAHLKSAHR
jgi:hypothetical protein